ncbi:MAG: hypothetical protein ACSHXG_15135 [Maribacter stanieri]
MINYNKIFQIRECNSNRPFRGKIENFNFATPEISRVEISLTEIVAVKHTMGGKTLYDIIWTTNAFPLIVSKRVIELFKSNAITGWKTYDVKIYSKKDELIDKNYFGLIITGRCGYRDYSTSSIVMDKIGITAEPHLKGYYFKDDFWDGSDLFMSNPDEKGEAPMYRFCSERVVQLFKKEKIQNIVFKEVTEFTMSISSYEIGLYEIGLTEKQQIEIEKLKASR